LFLCCIQLFFHKYFSNKSAAGDDKAKAGKKRKAHQGADSDDEDSIGDLGFSDKEDDVDGLAEAMGEVEGTDDEAEEEIWRAMKKSMPKRAQDDDFDEDEEMDDDEEDLAEFDYSDSDDEKAADAADVPFKSAFGDEEDGFDDDDDDNLIEDDADLIGSDEDMPMFGEDDDDEEEGAKGSKSKDRKSKKRKLNKLPMFATADDYAHLLGGSDDEDDV
jgi:ribosome biogenesis protein MAK21